MRGVGRTETGELMYSRWKAKEYKDQERLKMSRRKSLSSEKGALE